VVCGGLRVCHSVYVCIGSVMLCCNLYVCGCEICRLWLCVMNCVLQVVVVCEFRPLVFFAGPNSPLAGCR
jgi:hypothetical protein